MKKKISIYKYIGRCLDFEGSIGISRHKTKNENYQYTGHITIGNVEKELLEDFRDDVGFGKIDNGYIPSEKRQKLYRWSMSRKEVELYLPKIIPYLTVKWQQAELILRLFSILKTFEFQYKLNNQTRFEMYTYEEKLSMDLIWQACFSLNEDWNIKNKHNDNDFNIYEYE